MAYYRINNRGAELPSVSRSWDVEDERPGMSVCLSWDSLVEYFARGSSVGIPRTSRAWLIDADLVICDGQVSDVPDVDAADPSRPLLLVADTVTVIERRPLTAHEIAEILRSDLEHDVEEAIRWADEGEEEQARAEVLAAWGIH